MKITSKQKNELENAYRKEQDAKIKIRILAAIFMFIDEKTVEETSLLLRLGTTMVQNYRLMYKDGGIEALRVMGHSSGAPSLLTEEQQLELKEIVSKEIFLNSKQVCVLVEQRWSIIYTPNAMTKLLKRLGFSYKKPKSVPGKANADKQLEYLNQQLAPALANADENNPVYFVDAVHMMHNSQAAYGWILKGENKELKQNSSRERVNINGAISFHDQQFIYRNDVTINAESAVNLLKQIRNEHPIDIKIAIILDNARYNHAKPVKAYAENNNILLLYLPSYSPNLNLIERMWRFLKRNITYNTYYEKFSIFRDAIFNFLDGLPSRKTELMKFLTPKFDIIGAT